MKRHTSSFLSILTGLTLAVVITACSGNKTETNQTSTETSNDTTVMGVQGDTTTNDLDGPISAPGDTATGQTLPPASVKDS